MHQQQQCMKSHSIILIWHLYRKHQDSICDLYACSVLNNCDVLASIVPNFVTWQCASSCGVTSGLIWRRPSHTAGTEKACPQCVSCSAG